MSVRSVNHYIYWTITNHFWISKFSILRKTLSGHHVRYDFKWKQHAESFKILTQSLEHLPLLYWTLDLDLKYFPLSPTEIAVTVQFRSEERDSCGFYWQEELKGGENFLSRRRGRPTHLRCILSSIRFWFPLATLLYFIPFFFLSFFFSLLSSETATWLQDKIKELERQKLNFEVRNCTGNFLLTSRGNDAILWIFIELLIFRSMLEFPVNFNLL